MTTSASFHFLSHYEEMTHAPVIERTSDGQPEYAGSELVAFLLRHMADVGTTYMPELRACFVTFLRRDDERKPYAQPNKSGRGIRLFGSPTVSKYKYVVRPVFVRLDFEFGSAVVPQITLLIDGAGKGKIDMEEWMAEHYQMLVPYFLSPEGRTERAVELTYWVRRDETFEGNPEGWQEGLLEKWVQQIDVDEFEYEDVIEM
ncbi:MAG: hypothetical protein ABEN55_03785 [Bradymonadaceae bacterium]